MTIHLPPELERRIHAAVHGGRFHSVDDAMAEAVRLLLRDLGQEQAPATSQTSGGNSLPDPILGLMRNDAELMDEIVTDAYRQRREEGWRELNL